MKDGRQPAKAVDLQFGKASTGTVQIAVTFEITDGPDLGDYVTWLGSLTDKAAAHTLKALAVMGAPHGKTLDQLGVSDLGSLVSLVLEWETHQGKRRLRVKWVNRPGGGFNMKDKLDAEALRLLGAEWAADFDQTERYEPIPIPEPSPGAGGGGGEAEPEEEPDYGGHAPPPTDGDNPFTSGAPSDDIPF